MKKPLLRRVCEPWWHWPLAVLSVLTQISVSIALLFGLAFLIGTPLNKWREAHPDVYLGIVLSCAALAMLVMIIVAVRIQVNHWRDSSNDWRE